MAEPNPTQNLFGSGGSDGIAGKATTSLRTMSTASQQLITNLRTARDLMSQMERSSATIARNLRASGGGGMGGGGGGIPSNNSGGVGSSGNNLLRQTSFSIIGTAVGSAMGGALGAVQNNLLGFSDRATQVRQWNPGRFGSQASALRSTMPWLAAGQNASDALSAYTLYNQGFGGSNFQPFANAAALGSRLTGASFADSLNAATGLQNMNMVWMLRANGIQPRTPGSMNMMTPQQMASSLYSRGNFAGMNAKQRADAINFSLRPGGYLRAFMNNGGLSSDSQNLLTSLLLAQSNSNGKDISKMSQGDIEKLLSSGNYGNYRGDQAKRAAAAAQAQIGMVDSADTSYSAVASAQTAILHSMDNTLGRILEALTGGAMGAGSAMGMNATGLLGGIAGNLIANRIAGGGAGGAGGLPGSILRGAGSLLRGVGRGSLLRGVGRVGGGAVLGAVAGYGGGWLRNKLEGVNGGVDPNDNSSGANWRRFGTLALGVGQSAAVGASIGMMFGPWGAGAGAVAGTVWGLGRGILDWAGQGGNYGTVQQDNPNTLADGQAEVGSRGTPGTGGNSRTSAATGGSAASSTGLIDEAMRWLGTPYSYGGGNLSGPTKGSAARSKNTTGFDCSSFTQYVFHKFGVNLPRTSQAQASAGKEVPRDQAAKGDLLIFTFDGVTNGHVGIYLGGNKMIHCPHTGAVVSIGGVPWAAVSHVRRVIGSSKVGGDTSGSGSGSGTAIGTSGTGSSIGTSSGGPYWNGHGPVYYGDPASTATDAANNTGGANTGSTSSAGGGGKAAPKGQVTQWIDDALKILGKDPKQFEYGLYQMIMHESSGNPRAQNNTDSNAKAGHPSKGMMQTIDSTFNQWSIAGHKNIWNPVDNIIAGFRYAEHNYGDAMIAAGGRHDSKGGYLGYSEGAWRINRDQTARIHEGEMILPKAMAESMRTAIREGFAGNRDSGHAPIQVTMNVTINGASEKSATEMVRKFEQTVTRARNMSTVRTR